MHLEAELEAEKRVCIVNDWGEAVPGVCVGGGAAKEDAKPPKRAEDLQTVEGGVQGRAKILNLLFSEKERERDLFFKLTCTVMAHRINKSTLFSAFPFLFCNSSDISLY